MHGMGGGRRYLDINVSSFAAAFVLVFSEIGYQMDYRLLSLPLAANRHINSLAVLE